MKMGAYGRGYLSYEGKEAEGMTEGGQGHFIVPKESPMRLTLSSQDPPPISQPAGVWAFKTLSLMAGRDKDYIQIMTLHTFLQRLMCILQCKMHCLSSRNPIVLVEHGSKVQIPNLTCDSL